LQLGGGLFEAVFLVWLAWCGSGSGFLFVFHAIKKEAAIAQCI
jgi:hypothetical protein